MYLSLQGVDACRQWCVPCRWGGRIAHRLLFTWGNDQGNHANSQLLIMTATSQWRLHVCFTVHSHVIFKHYVKLWSFRYDLVIFINFSYSIISLSGLSYYHHMRQDYLALFEMSMILYSFDQSRWFILPVSSYISWCIFQNNPVSLSFLVHDHKESPARIRQIDKVGSWHSIFSVRMLCSMYQLYHKPSSSILQHMIEQNKPCEPFKLANNTGHIDERMFNLWTACSISQKLGASHSLNLFLWVLRVLPKRSWIDLAQAQSLKMYAAWCLLVRDHDFTWQLDLPTP